MYWYWEDSDSQFAMENMVRMNELNQAIEDLMQPYIHWVEDVLRVKCCYEKLLSDYLHIKHGFLTEADLAEMPEGRRTVPGSVAFVPSVAGLMIAGEVIRDLVHR